MFHGRELTRQDHKVSLIVSHKWHGKLLELSETGNVLQDISARGRESVLMITIANCNQRISVMY